MPDVSFNDATYQQLIEIDRVGHILAKRLIKSKQSAPFASWDDVLDVPGVGEIKLGFLKGRFEEPRVDAGETSASSSPPASLDVQGNSHATDHVYDLAEPIEDATAADDPKHVARVPDLSHEISQETKPALPPPADDDLPAVTDDHKHVARVPDLSHEISQETKPALPPPADDDLPAVTDDADESKNTYGSAIQHLSSHSLPTDGFMTTKQFREFLKKWFNVEGMDVAHIIAASNGGPDHVDNYMFVQSSAWNRSLGARFDALNIAMVGQKQAERAVRISKMVAENEDLHKHLRYPDNPDRLYTTGPHKDKTADDLHEEGKKIMKIIKYVLRLYLQGVTLSDLRYAMKTSAQARNGAVSIE